MSSEEGKGKEKDAPANPQNPEGEEKKDEEKQEDEPKKDEPKKGKEEPKQEEEITTDRFFFVAIHPEVMDGRPDPPISQAGRLDAVAMGQWFQGTEFFEALKDEKTRAETKVTVGCATSLRCIQTMRAIGIAHADIYSMVLGVPDKLEARKDDEGNIVREIVLACGERVPFGKCPQLKDTRRESHRVARTLPHGSLVIASGTFLMNLGFKPTRGRGSLVAVSVMTDSSLEFATLYPAKKKAG